MAATVGILSRCCVWPCWCNEPEGSASDPGTCDFSSAGHASLCPTRCTCGFSQTGTALSCHSLNLLFYWWLDGWIESIHMRRMGGGPGACPTNNISIKFEIQPKFGSALVWNLFNRSQQHFAHVTTVILSWCVQNFVVYTIVTCAKFGCDRWSTFKLEHCNFWSNFKFRSKYRQWDGRQIRRWLWPVGITGPSITGWQEWV